MPKRINEQANRVAAESFLLEARKSFHASLLENILTTNAEGIPSIADKDSTASVTFAIGIMSRLKASRIGARLVGQMSGSKFEGICKEFLETVFPKLAHLRPGTWEIGRGGAKFEIGSFDQYQHLAELEELIEEHPKLRTSLGSNYLIKPDIVIVRSPESDEKLNEKENLVDEHEARYTSLRAINQHGPTLHASISCKWTIRSDRAQNARSEALNLIRYRKGKLPHIAVVMGEPLPSRIASLALGTGDIDCVYHMALPELIAAVEESSFDDSKELLRMMVDGKRLRDISDLPLDLVI